MTRTRPTFTLLCFTLTAAAASAQSTPPPTQAEPTAEAEPDEPSDASAGSWGSSIVDFLTRIAMHGFVSQGFILTTDNNYLARSEEGSFEFAEAGLNFTTQPVEKLRIGVQLFARDLGPIGNYEARFDWFYADYRFSDAFGLRVGRVKVPFGLYNEINDIDVARVPVLLPQSVYPTSSRDFLLAQTGLELYGLLDLGGAGFLDYRAYGGTIFLASQPSRTSPFEIADLTVPYLVGGRLLWETPLAGLRLGGSIQALRLESELLGIDLAIATDPDTGAQTVEQNLTPFSVDIPAILWVASLEFATGDSLFAAEYSRWHLEVESSDGTRFPESDATNERAYAMLAHRFSDHFHPSIYYSLLFPDVDDREGRESVQHDVALSLRFDINSNWLFKAEGHFMSGTAALSSSLNDGAPNELTTNWGLFLLKTTAYF